VAWRTVMIQNAARMRLHKGQLQLEQDAGMATVPLEDITCLILESPQISLTSSVLAACAEHSVAVIVCDAKHMPSGVMLPFHPHSRQSRIGHVQLSWSEPLRKRLWQAVVQCKILNQAEVLAAAGKDATRLYTLSKTVQSGDPNNIEAQAARYYWTACFGKTFIRAHEDAVNAALNYGYAVVRGIVARSQVAYGLLPAFGIHHCNQLNAFNLTDDMMEVFRPCVDALVLEMVAAGAITPDAGSLSKEARARLAGIGSVQCRMGKETHSLINATELMTQSLIQAIEAKSAALLVLPTHHNNRTVT
jgi:CRISP-associated protein Cas1